MKKLIGLGLSLAMLASSAAPALAARRIFIRNINWVSSNDNMIMANSWSGGEIIDDNNGQVVVVNDNADADATGAVITNTEVSSVGGPGSSSRRVAVTNFNGVGGNFNTVGSTAYTGGDIIINNDGGVDVYNGTSTSSTQGFVVTNTSITRVR